MSSLVLGSDSSDGWSGSRNDGRTAVGESCFVEARVPGEVHEAGHQGGILDTRLGSFARLRKPDSLLGILAISSLCRQH